MAPDAYAAALDTDSPRTGGAETQQVRFATGLRDAGWDVSMIVAYSPDADPAGDRPPPWVIPAYRLRETRSRKGYLSDSFSLFSVMSGSGADVFIQRCSFHDAPRVRLASAMMGSRFVFWVGADYNVDRQWISRNLSLPRRIAYLNAIVEADLVICQTCSQRDALLRDFGIRASLVRNIVDLPPADALVREREDERRPLALWGGRINSNKRPGDLLHIARSTREWDFVAVALRERELDSEYEAFILGASEISNLEVIPAVPHRGYLHLTSSADLVLNTSRMEGFPNTLLEGFARAVPALTLGVDPDGIISRKGLGWVTGSVREAVTGLKHLAAQRGQMRTAGDRARAFVRDHHSPEATVGVLAEQLKGLLEG